MQRNFAYPPSPTERHPGELENKLSADPLDALRDVARECGDISYFKLGEGANVYLVNNPQLIQRVLVTENRTFRKSNRPSAIRSFQGKGLIVTEGDFHHKQKRLLQPAFHQVMVNSFGDMIVDYTRRTLDNWKDGETIDVWDEMIRLTVRIVAKALFNVGMDEPESQRITEALGSLHNAKEANHRPIAQDSKDYDRFTSSSELMESVAYSQIKQRRESGRDEGDMLSLLVRTSDPDAEDGKMSDKQIRDHLMALFYAAFDTTGTTIAWTWYLLAQHPQIEAKVRSEVDSVLGGQAPKAEDFSRLSYTNQVITESLRIIPPSWILQRVPDADVSLGKYTIPRGSTVLMSQYLIHHDPRYYSEPEKFMPERWTPEFRKVLPKLAYFPFGAGPHICVGEPLAWLEAALVTATIAQGWSLYLAEGQKVEFDTQWNGPVKNINTRTMIPKGGLRMTPKRRSS